MYAGAYDERFRCVVPTCSVGTYQSYLSAACCMCEVVPGALRFTEEGDILGLAAGRGLMVTSATQDAFQFSVDQAKISIARARQISKLIGGTDVRHTIIESPHHYNQPMREAMYGWMTLHLKGEGNGEPIAEPEVIPEDPETIRCYPGTSRPDNYMTLPRFAAREAHRLLESQLCHGEQQWLSRHPHLPVSKQLLEKAGSGCRACWKSTREFPMDPRIRNRFQIRQILWLAEASSFRSLSGWTAKYRARVSGSKSTDLR